MTRDLASERADRIKELMMKLHLSGQLLREFSHVEPVLQVGVRGQAVLQLAYVGLAEDIE